MAGRKSPDITPEANKLAQRLQDQVNSLMNGKSISEVSKDLERIIQELKNPHLALEIELAKLVEAKTPPNGEFYKTRADKNEFAVAFFHRVYGRFYKAKVLRYKSQVQAMDADFAHLLGQYTQSIHLLTKREENDEALAKFGSFEEVMRLASVAVRRKSKSA